MRCIWLASFSLLLGATWAQEASAATLLSHFTFDSDFTNAVSASLDSPYQVGATIDNATSRVGGGSVLFDGGTTPEYVNIGTDAVPNSATAFNNATVALWFKAGAGLTVGSRALMGQTNGDPAIFGADNRMAFLLETDGNGKLRLFIRAADGSESNNRLRFSHDSTDPNEYLKWADGDWHHLAYSWSVDSSGLVSRQLYLDGAPLPTVTQENTLEDDPAKSVLKPWETPGMFIGAQNNRSLQTAPAGIAPDGDNPVGHVNGWIDDLRVYDGVLSDSEVWGLYVPEPTSVVLGAIGLIGVLAARRRG